MGKSSTLRVAELASGAVLFSVVLVYYILQLHVLFKSHFAISSTMALQAPMTDWYHCSTIQGTCKQQFDLVSEDPFCKDGTNKCTQAAETFLLPGGINMPSAHLDVATSFVNLGKTSCLGTTCTAQASQVAQQSGPRERRYIAGLDYFNIKFNHLFVSPEWSIASPYLQGFVQYKNESKPRRITFMNESEPKTNELWEDRTAGYWEGAYPDLCGGTREQAKDASGRFTCMNTPWGDYISIGVLLEAAGLTDTTNNKTLRKDGAMLRLELVFTDMDFSDFWCYDGIWWQWPLCVGRKKKYVLKPTLGAYGHDGKSFFEDFESVGGSPPRERFVKTCIHAHLDARGTHGTYSLGKFLLDLIVEYDPRPSQQSPCQWCSAHEHSC